MRAELRGLKRELAAVRRALADEHGAQLREANEQLVLAALRADRIGSDAEASARQAGALPATAPGLDEAAALALREANEALLLTALDARIHEEDVVIAHRRQLRYLAVVAHELRSPMSPIRIAASTLGMLVGDAEKLRQVQEIIKRQVAHMSRLVEDLLDAARVDAVDFRVDIEPVDVGEVLEQAVEVVHPLIDGRAQRLQVDLPPPPPLIVAGDAIRLAQVFNNLLENASKYTPAGGEIRLCAVRRSTTVDVHVADNGIGISAAALPRVFDLFMQETSHSSQRGLGIGLAVVRGLVNALGGTIVVTSAGPGQGSEFVVTLPLANALPE